MKFLSYEIAKEEIKKLGLKSASVYRNYHKINKPKQIPSAPEIHYQNKGWIDWADWLGTKTVASQKMKFLPFEAARGEVRKLGLKSASAYIKYHKRNSPPGIPFSPDKRYKSEGWIDWADWLGTKTVASQNRVFRPFAEAREYARSFNFPSKKYWNEHVKKDTFPLDIPKSPTQPYKKEWVSWPDWLGTKTVASQKMKFLPFEEAREYVHSKGIKSVKAWREYCKSSRKETGGIPYNPDKYIQK